MYNLMKTKKEAHHKFLVIDYNQLKALVSSVTAWQFFCNQRSERQNINHMLACLLAGGTFNAVTLAWNLVSL